MSIRGIHKTSLIDYPGKICSVIFFEGCNLHCGYCHNPELTCSKCSVTPYTEEEALDQLDSRAGLIDGVTITGGEPTIFPMLGSFIRKIKKTGLSVKLDTNGLNPDVIHLLLEDELLDYVAIDVKTSADKYEILTGMHVDFNKLLSTINFVRDSGIEYELRTTCIPYFVTLQDLKSIMNKVGRVKKYFLQQFINDITLDESFHNYKPYSHKDLKELCDFTKGFADVCELRGV